jgi:hypothetical protein
VVGERRSRTRDPTSSVSVQPEAGKAASARSSRLMNGQMLARREKVFREKPLIVRRFPPNIRLIRLLGEGERYAKISDTQIKLRIYISIAQTPRITSINHGPYTAFDPLPSNSPLGRIASF